MPLKKSLKGVDDPKILYSCSWCFKPVTCICSVEWTRWILQCPSCLTCKETWHALIKPLHSGHILNEGIHLSHNNPHQWQWSRMWTWAAVMYIMCESPGMFLVLLVRTFSVDTSPQENLVLFMLVCCLDHPNLLYWFIEMFPFTYSDFLSVSALTDF